VGLIGLLNPVTGVLLGTAVAGELLTVQQMCGLILVLAGVVLGRPKRAGRRESPQPPSNPRAAGWSARALSLRNCPETAGRDKNRTAIPTSASAGPPSPPRKGLDAQ
jgi:probable blue pigment (indigoidine) exporter